MIKMKEIREMSWRIDFITAISKRGNDRSPLSIKPLASTLNARNLELCRVNAPLGSTLKVNRPYNAFSSEDPYVNRANVVPRNPRPYNHMLVLAAGDPIIIEGLGYPIGR